MPWVSNSVFRHDVGNVVTDIYGYILLKGKYSFKNHSKIYKLQI